MKEEISMMKARKVWRLVPTPENTRPLGCRWVFTLKKNETGRIARYKARLVAQGYTQVKGETYDETFSPVVNFSLIRFFFAALVSCQKWTHLQCDVKGAYLYAPLKGNIFMKQPQGFAVKGKENMVCKLERAIYGLHQSGRLWFYELHTILENIGFKKLNWCNCAYTYSNNLVLLVYVDDFVILGKTKRLIDKAINLLAKYFDLKILGKTRKLLGVEFEEENENLLLHQAQYIDEVFSRFEDFKPPISSLPIAKGTVYSKTQCPQSDSEMNEMRQIPYKSVLGCLSFIASRTRPDISYAVNIFSQFQSNPGIHHWNGLLKLLGYVQHTKHMILNISCTRINLITYSDADFASNRDDRTSMGGQILLLEKAPIAWKTNKQKSVSLSTMESEFVALTDAAKELLWFDRIIKECYDKKIFSEKNTQPKLLVDNMAAIDFLKSPIENYRTKHIDVKMFFVRDLLNQEIFEVNYIKSKANLADMFTKPLTKHDLYKFVEAIFKLKS